MMIRGGALPSCRLLINDPNSPQSIIIPTLITIIIAIWPSLSKWYDGMIGSIPCGCIECITAFVPPALTVPFNSDQENLFHCHFTCGLK